MPVEERTHGHARPSRGLPACCPTPSPCNSGGHANSTSRRPRRSRSSRRQSARTAPAASSSFVRTGSLPCFADPGSVEWLDDDDLEARLRRLRTEGTAWLGEGDQRPGFVGRFSLAGRQRKTALLFDGYRWGVPAGRIPTTHILKPAIEDYADQEINEHLCLAAARIAGLVTVESRVQAFGTESVIVVTRYDRQKIGDRLVRIHQEDLCQALGVHPDRKYQSDGGPGPRQIASLLRAVMPADVAERSVARFADALIWNWIVGGTDAHAKNYSLLLAGAAVRLAPFYDVTSALPYGNPHDLRLAMKVDDGYALLHHRNPWPVAAHALGVDAGWLTARATELCDAAPPAFTAAAADPAVAAFGKRSTGRLVELVERSATRCLRLLR